MFQFLKQLFANKNNNEAGKPVKKQQNYAIPLAGVENVTFFGRTTPQEQVEQMKTAELATCFLEKPSVLKLDVVKQFNNKSDFLTYLDKNPRFFQKAAYELFEIAKASKNTKVIADILATLNKKPLFSFFSNPAEQFLQENPKFITLAAEEIFSNHSLQNLQAMVLKKLNKKTDHQICAIIGENTKLAMSILARVSSDNKYKNIKDAINIWQNRPAPKKAEEPTAIFYKACWDNNFHLIEQLQTEIEWEKVSVVYLHSLLMLFDKKPDLVSFNADCPGLVKSISHFVLTHVLKNVSSNDFFSALDSYPNVKQFIGMPNNTQSAHNGPEHASQKMTKV